MYRHVCVHHILLFLWQLAIELRVYEAAGGSGGSSAAVCHLELPRGTTRHTVLLYSPVSVCILLTSVAHTHRSGSTPSLSLRVHLSAHGHPRMSTCHAAKRQVRAARSRDTRHACSSSSSPLYTSVINCDTRHTHTYMHAHVHMHEPSHSALSAAGECCC